MPLGHFSFFVDGTSEAVRTALAPSISVGSDAANQTFFLSVCFIDFGDALELFPLGFDVSAVVRRTGVFGFSLR